MKIHDFWYDTPKRNDGGRWVLGLVIRIEGQAVIHFYLTIPEMREVLAELKHHNVDRDGEPLFENEAGTKSKAWWSYESVNVPEDDDDYRAFDLAGKTVEDVPVCLYRDDHFFVTLPHEVGEELIEIIEQRLALAGASAQFARAIPGLCC